MKVSRLSLLCTTNKAKQQHVYRHPNSETIALSPYRSNSLPHPALVNYTIYPSIFGEPSTVSRKLISPQPHRRISRLTPRHANACRYPVHMDSPTHGVEKDCVWR